MLESTTELPLSGITLGYLASLLLTIFSVSITPGPNNLMLTASGMNFGYQRTLPHILGITMGCLLLMTLIASGLGSLFVRFPTIHTALKIFGALYLSWLAYKIFTAGAPGQSERVKPFGFFQALLFQFVNPKAWTMGITSVSAFSLSGDLLLPSLVLIVVVHTVMCPPCCSVWALMGVKIKAYIHKPGYQAWFNRTLGLITAACVVVILN